MKLIKLALCLIVISACVLEITASANLIQKKKSTKSQKIQGKSKEFWDFLKSWNFARLTITNEYQREFKFGAEIKQIEYTDTKKAFGIAFNKMDQVKTNDQSGFVNNVLSYELVQNLGEGDKPILDFRQIKDCEFTDNRKAWIGDWTIWFDVQPYEGYLMGQTQQFGRQWNVEMKLPNANKAAALDIIKYLHDACAERNKQINGLKTAAVSSGDVYHKVRKNFEVRETSLEKQVELGAKQEQVLAQVQSNAEAASESISQKIAQNQAELEAAIKKLQASTAANAGVQEKISAFNTEMDAVQRQLKELQVQINGNNNEIQTTEQNLNAAIAYKNSKLSEQERLAQSQAQIEAKKQQEQAQLNQIVQDQEAKMAKLKEEFAKRQAAIDKALADSKAASASKQADLKKESKDVADQSGKVQEQIAQTVKNIQLMSEKVQGQKQQSQALQKQVKDTQSQVETIQNQIASQTSVANSLANEISLQKAMKADEEKQLEEIKKQAEQQLAEFAKKEKAQLAKLDQNNEQVKKAQADFDNAQKEVNNAYLKFNGDLQNIVHKAQRARPRTNQALIQVMVGPGLHGAEINAIVSQSNQGVRMAQQRLAKFNKEMQRLALVQKSQIKKVRMARKNAKNTKKAKKAKKAKKIKRIEQ